MFQSTYHFAGLDVDVVVVVLVSVVIVVMVVAFVVAALLEEVDTVAPVADVEEMPLSSCTHIFVGTTSGTS
jgi:hypothetical protein